jgi:hypothetical protein
MQQPATTSNSLHLYLHSSQRQIAGAPGTVSGSSTPPIRLISGIDCWSRSNVARKIDSHGLPLLRRGLFTRTAAAKQDKGALAFRLLNNRIEIPVFLLS